MKATDLMIKDWVNSQLDGHPIQIDEEVFYILIKGYDDGIEPIPITAEILEKNGFWVMEKADNGAEEYIAYAIDGLIFHYNRDNDYYFPNTPISWKYVHELQHTLRLCGLEELADNFKI